MSFKYISSLELWRPFCSAERNHLCNYGRRYNEERFCKIILSLDQWFRRGLLYLIWSFAGPFVQRSETNCAILVEGIKRNNSVKNFEFGPVVQEEISFKLILIWSSGSSPVRWSRIFCEILKDGNMRNIHVKLYAIWTSG